MNKIKKLSTLWLTSLTLLASASSIAKQEIKPDHEMGKNQQVARTLISYTSDTTVRPGDTVDVMVSTIGNTDPFSARLVKVINGDDLSTYYKHFKVNPVKSDVDGKYDGTTQPLNLGSYINIAETKKLDKLADFSIGAWIFPTFDPSEYTAPDLENIDPFSPPTLSIAKDVKVQTVLSRFDTVSNIGWAIQINEKFHLEFVVGDGSGELQRVTMKDKLTEWDWTYLAVSYNSESGQVSLYAFEKPYSPGDQFTARTLKATGNIKTIPHQGALRIAAKRGGPGALAAKLEKPADVFTGRIQDVRIAKSTLNQQQLSNLSNEVADKSVAKQLVANFDFGQGIKTKNITDISSNKLVGELVNIAERGVRGRYWKGNTTRWTDDPSQYDAITFYPDDLYDAEWKPSFSYKIPANLPSGIYAFELTQGDFSDYATFFVAAPKHKPGAKLAILLSDYNYLAYSNVSITVTAAKNYPGHSISERDKQFFLENLAYATGGVYNMHIDGQYYMYGSRLRPDLGLKPSGNIMYNFVEDTHITAFLEHNGIKYDILTESLLAKDGSDLLNQYTAVISATHPEYTPTSVLDGIKDFTANGGRFIYMAGNGYFWAVEENPAFPGVMESRNFNAIGERYLTTGSRGGLMVEAARNTGPVFGLEMAAMIFNGSSPYKKMEDAKNPRASWIFEGTSEGDIFGEYGPDRVKGGAAGFEIDRFVAGNGAPRHLLRLANSEPLLPKVEDVKLSQLPLTISYHPSSGDMWADSDVVYFETANGGAVFAAGSNVWISAALHNNFKNDIATITLNVINRFLDPKPFPAVPKNEVKDDERLINMPDCD